MNRVERLLAVIARQGADMERLRAENADLRARLLASHAVVKTISTGTIQGAAKVLAAMFMLDPDDPTGLRMARRALKPLRPKRRGGGGGA